MAAGRSPICLVKSMITDQIGRHKVLLPITFKRTIFIRLNAAAFINFLALPMRRLFEGDVYFEITFLKSLTTVTVHRL